MMKNILILVSMLCCTISGWTQEKVNKKYWNIETVLTPYRLPYVVWPNGHYMAVIDTDHDNVFSYIDWNTFCIESWEHIGLSNFHQDYSGNSSSTGRWI